MQLNLTSQALTDDPFRDKKQAMDFLQRNIGTFLTCFAAAGSAEVDLIELVLATRDHITDNIRRNGSQD